MNRALKENSSFVDSRELSESNFVRKKAQGCSWKQNHQRCERLACRSELVSEEVVVALQNLQKTELGKAPKTYGALALAETPRSSCCGLRTRASYLDRVFSAYLNQPNIVQNLLSAAIGAKRFQRAFEILAYARATFPDEPYFKQVSIDSQEQR